MPNPQNPSLVPFYHTPHTNPSNYFPSLILWYLPNSFGAKPEKICSMVYMGLDFSLPTLIPICPYLFTPLIPFPTAISLLACFSHMRLAAALEQSRNTLSSGSRHSPFLPPGASAPHLPLTSRCMCRLLPHFFHDYLGESVHQSFLCPP